MTPDAVAGVLAARLDDGRRARPPARLRPRQPRAGRPQVRVRAGPVDCRPDRRRRAGPGAARGPCSGERSSRCSRRRGTAARRRRSTPCWPPVTRVVAGPHRRAARPRRARRGAGDRRLVGARKGVPVTASGAWTGRSPTPYRRRRPVGVMLHHAVLAAEIATRSAACSTSSPPRRRRRSPRFSRSPAARPSHSTPNCSPGRVRSDPVSALRNETSAHARYGDRIATLLSIATLGPIGGAPAPGWSIHTARFQPERGSWATVVQRGPGRAVLQTVKLYDEYSTAPDGCVDTSAGPARVTAFPADEELPALGRLVASIDDPDIVRYRPGSRCTVRATVPAGVRWLKVFAGGISRQQASEAIARWRAAQTGSSPSRVASSPHRRRRQLRRMAVGRARAAHRQRAAWDSVRPGSGDASAQHSRRSIARRSRRHAARPARTRSPAWSAAHVVSPALFPTSPPRSAHACDGLPTERRTCPIHAEYRSMAVPTSTSGS